jgi:hypothetical protein
MGAAYDVEYGRMSGNLGLELDKVNSLNQNTALYGYASPPVDLLHNSTPLGTLADGTQLWKITHNGVDTHPIHFHLFNVQVINRVAWDGAMLPPEPNELGWKETVRTNPLEHLIVALRPVAPTQPFDLPNSVRLIDPTMPENVELRGGPVGFLDPKGVGVRVFNHRVNYGWEYVWHCHILSHEEMDMMHSLSFAIQPAAPTDLILSLENGTGPSVNLSWKDQASNATNFIVERFISGGTPTKLTSAVVAPGKGNTATYLDTTAIAGNTYFYRVTAVNTIGDATSYAPSIGYPTYDFKSAPLESSITV